MSRRQATKSQKSDNLFRDLVYFIFRCIFSIYFFFFGQPTVRRDVKKVMDLYDLDDFTSWFKQIRFWDAPYLEVEKNVPKKGHILELGCGEGLFTNFMALTSSRRKITAVDLDANRLKQADNGLPNTNFRVGDVTKMKIPKSDAIVMFHLLHHLLSYDMQETLIEKCVKALNKNGKLIIVEIDTRPLWKYLVSWFTDHYIVAVLFENRFYEPNIFFRKKDGWLKLFKKMDLKYSYKNVSQNKPFSHILFVIKRH